MESCEKIVSDFAEKNNCSIDEAKSQIDLLIKESRQTNLGISNAIKSNGYISFPNGLTIGKYGKNGELNSKYLCYTPNIKKIIEMDKKDVAIVSGFGATNSPTIGTLSMMIKLIELQKNTGFYTYVIINDLGSINARRLDPKYVIRLTDHFKDFLLKLGFDEKNGEIRTHNDLDHARTFSLVASTIKINDFSTNTEATDDTYNRLKLRGNDFSAMIDHVYTATDVLLPILKDKKIRENISQIIIEGHTDSHTFAGAKSEEEKYFRNMDLSLKRASSVAQYIVFSNYSGKKSYEKDLYKLMSVQGKSSSEPIFTNGKEDFSKSRRVELKIMFKDKSILYSIKKQ